MQKILLDTNFLLIPAQFKVDIFAEIERICDFKYELYTLKEVIGELKEIAKSHDKEGIAAKLALALINKKNVNIIKDGKKTKVDADKRILELADKGCMAATQDKELRKKLRAKGIKIIALRQKSYLKII